MQCAPPPNNIDQTNDNRDTCIATAAYAFKVATHCTLMPFPGAIVFPRSIMYNTPLVTDIHQLHACMHTHN
jgi:hypothetical protein